MRIIAMAMLALFILPAQGICDSTIYTWTDQNGVKQFSDQPPEDVDTYETITSRSSQDDTKDNGSGQSVRPEYERMVRQVDSENKQADQRRKQAEKESQKAEAQKAQAEKNAQREADRQKLQKAIDALNQRALSPTFSKGMRDSQIEALQKQIEALE